MNRFKFFIFSFLLIVILTGTVFACGPYFDNAYLVRGSERSFLAIPEGNFLSELEKITGHSWESKRKCKQAERTTQSDILDLEEALGKFDLSESEKKEILANFIKTRLEILHYLNTIRNYHNYYYGEYSDQKMYDSWYGYFRRHERAGAFSKLNFSPKFSKKCPAEFSRYIKGALSYHKSNFGRAIVEWKELLKIPKEERHYKSVWAAFMIGKAYLSKREPKKAIPYFELTRKYSSEGYKDSLNLAYESYGWQALAEYESGDYLSSINHYLKQMDNLSLGWICSKIFALEDDVFEEILRDDLARQILLAWSVCQPNRYYYDTHRGNKLLKAIEKLNIKNFIQNADRIALICYRGGDFDAAKRWVRLAKEKSGLAKWIMAKLMLREGKINPAIKKLREVLPLFEKNKEWNQFYAMYNKDIIRNVHTEIGVLRLKRQEYLMALDALIKGAYWEDAAYVAEKVLIKEELENYLKEHSEMENSLVCKDLRYLLARRFGRDGKWKKAIEYMPDISMKIHWYDDENNEYKTEKPKLKEELKNFHKHLLKAENSNLLQKKRAQNYYEAGLIMRKYGMELIGTELEPDWAVFKGRFDRNNSIAHRFGIKQRTFLAGSEDEEKRALNSLPSPHRRFHYRYKAADLMWKCAELLKDNDELKAKALWKGGTFLKIRDPKAADKFYKALVITCGKTKLGKDADKLRWFPKKESVKVCF